MDKTGSQKDITHLVEDKVIYLLAFAVVAQTLYLIMAQGSLAAIIGVLYLTIIMAWLVGLYPASDMEAEMSEEKNR